MKRVFIIFLALVLSLCLVSCGFAINNGSGGEDDDPPLRRETKTTTKAVAPGSTPSGGVDVDSIIPGYKGILGSMDDEAKEEIIRIARENGYEVTFNTDGSTVLTCADGTVIKQNSEGTWDFGAVTDIDIPPIPGAGEWPDNEFTRLVPKPDMEILAGTEEDGEFTVAFSGATLEQIKTYVGKLKVAGFIIDAETTDQDFQGITVYSYEASNKDGYTVTVSFTMGSAAMSISRSEE
ncbi:MAG: hypothetical protein J6Z80_02690 [Clostridia bacterium]|nr:hypothetical protein [Clostridia bacterium]